ncbi:MAG: hypothetical protein JWN10_974, partial [Solirubrobacterales bacterium]|nr:hypothetical protein [Solirubrobacterales bacterium]
MAAPLEASGAPERDADAHDGPTPRVAAESFRELVELDGAHSVRWAKPIESTLALELDELDVAMLELIAAMRHVLTSQLHRRFNPGRAATTTQRRLKRLSDAAMVERFQFHRRDGGGIPMCYVIADAGLRALAAHGHEPKIAGRPELAAATGSNGRRRDDGRLRQARHDVHVAGWALALADMLGEAGSTLRGPEASTLSPPSRGSGEARLTLTPRELRLPGGRTPHDFLRTDATGVQVELERFETLRPDAIVAVAGEGRSRQSTDVIVELDDRPAVGRDARKLERYDHFLGGWSLHTSRYGRRAEAVPVVVFVCRDRARARECARRADSVLRACRAYAGEYPLDWEYPGRERIVFVAERDAHEGLLRAYGVPRLPPDVRVIAAHGDPRARETTTESRQLLTPAHAAVRQASP